MGARSRRDGLSARDHLAEEFDSWRFPGIDSPIVACHFNSLLHRDCADGLAGCRRRGHASGKIRRTPQLGIAAGHAHLTAAALADKSRPATQNRRPR